MPSSYQQHHQSSATTPSKRDFHTTETVEHGLSKGQYDLSNEKQSSTTILNNNIHISPSLCSNTNKHLLSADCAHHTKVEIKMSDSQTSVRDRLGLWGTHDSEIASTVSGLDRLKQGRYNKVSNFIYVFLCLMEYFYFENFFVEKFLQKIISIRQYNRMNVLSRSALIKLLNLNIVIIMNLN